MGALVSISTGGDDGELFNVVVLWNDEYTGVAVDLTKVSTEQLQHV